MENKKSDKFTFLLRINKICVILIQKFSWLISISSIIDIKNSRGDHNIIKQLLDLIH